MSMRTASAGDSWVIRLGVIALGMVSMSQAHAEGSGLGDAFKATKPILDMRLRTEDVDQEGIANDANAMTLRLRAGFETGKAWNTTLLVEGGGTIPIDDEYRADPMIPEMTTYPVVADPEAYYFNRFQLVNTSIPGTTLTLGRQRILLDDHRFVGNVGWRQNEQTFDALRIVNKSVKGLVLDATYFDRVNRVFGPDSPQGHYEGDSVLLNASYQTKIGKISAYNYLLDFENIVGVPAAVRDSTNTLGARFAGDFAATDKVKIGYIGAYAMQEDYADNPLAFELDYYNIEGSVTVKQYGFAVGIESMEGNGVKGFTTPLATLHKFQGWADKFLGTPANGIDDTYVNLTGNFKAVGGLDTLAVVIGFHDYEAQRIDADYGSEINISVAAKFKKMNAMLKYADYQEGVLASARNTQKLWMQFEYVW